ncbi:MAG TPA: DUF5004 domain-containing protein [Chitinophagaceae bacterium]|nr:DUF5004 domain-containing protein [Chitinophagaceae bacterium]
MKKQIVMVVGIITALVSCQKETSVSPPASEKMKLLTAREWVVLKAEEKNDIGVWEDVFPLFEDCLKDNRFKFNTDFSVVYGEGPDACSPNSPNQVIYTGSWKFNADETAIITDDTENKILQLDASRLVMTTIETDAGVTYESRITFRH